MYKCEGYIGLTNNDTLSVKVGDAYRENVTKHETTSNHIVFHLKFLYFCIYTTTLVFRSIPLALVHFHETMPRLVKKKTIHKIYRYI